MNPIDDNSDLESADTDFEEQTARDLVYLILENDVKVYRKLLPEIRKLDSDSFKNMFQGNKKYDYNIKNKSKVNFNSLVDKFENFKYLLEEWYEDKDTHVYIQELWEKYISIESMRDKTEKEIENFLSEKKIHYKSWPEKIKDQFLKIIQNTKDTFIFACKKSFQKLPNSIKHLLGKLYSISKHCKEKGKNIFSKLSKNQIFIIAKEFLNIKNIDLDNFPSLCSIIIEMVSIYKDKAIDFALELGGNVFDILYNDFSNIKEGGNLQLIASSIYSVFSLYNLYNSYENYKMTKAQLEKIKGYEDQINEIEKDFEEHQKRYEDLSENNKLDINEFNLELNK